VSRYSEILNTRCGIMDQFISCCGHAPRAMMLDCRSLEYRLLPLPPDVSLAICNTMVKHELANGEYTKRRRSAFPPLPKGRRK
jgi:galactokinase